MIQIQFTLVWISSLVGFDFTKLIICPFFCFFSDYFQVFNMEIGFDHIAFIWRITTKAGYSNGCDFKFIATINKNGIDCSRKKNL